MIKLKFGVPIFMTLMVLIGMFFIGYGIKFFFENEIGKSVLLVALGLGIILIILQVTYSWIRPITKNINLFEEMMKENE